MANTREERQNEFLQKFLKSRKSEETKKYVQIIMNYLSEQRGEQNKKISRWVQSRDFIVAMVDSGKIPNSSTFYKLLKDLVDAGLIERKKGLNKKSKPGRPPVFYRVPVYYPSIWFMSRDEMMKFAVELDFYAAAVRLTLSNHPDIGPVLDQEICQNFKKIKDRKMELLNDLQKSDEEIGKEVTERKKRINLVDGLDNRLDQEEDLEHVDHWV